MSSKGGHTRKRPSTSLTDARPPSPPFSRAAARCAMFPGNTFDLPIELYDDSPPSASSSKRRRVEASRPVSEWKPKSGRHRVNSPSHRREARVLAPKVHENRCAKDIRPETHKHRPEKQSQPQPDPPSQAKQPTQPPSVSSLEMDHRKFDALMKQIQVQNMTIKGLENKMEKILTNTKADILELLNRVRDQEMEAKTERREILDQVRMMMAELLLMTIRQTTGVDFNAPASVPSTLPPAPQVAIQAPVFNQPTALPNVFVDSTGTYDIAPSARADPLAPFREDQWAINAAFPANAPLQAVPTDQSSFSTYISDDDWYSAKDAISNRGTQFPAVDQQLSVFLSQLVDDPTFSGYPSMLNDIHLRANPKRRGLDGYWQTSADGINSYQVFQPPLHDATQPFVMPDMGGGSSLSTRSLSSGIESLPSSCTRETSTAASDAPSTSGRSLRARTRKPDYVGHPMDALKKPLQTVTSEENAQGDGADESEDERHVRGRSACLPETHLGPSNGTKTGTGAIWPNRSANTIKGRKQDVQCDHCKGRAHVACAGYDDQAELRRLPWSCPECTLILDSNEGETVPPITQSQEERCLRPDCILRTRKKVERRHRDEDEFYIERIIGRMRMTPAGRAKHQYEYLVKWTDYPVYESTWEPATNIRDLEYYIGHFISRANLEHADMNRRVVMFKETEEYWDDKGQRDEEKLEKEGVERKEWWY